jgi:tRNA dimethylallyltransferase
MDTNKQFIVFYGPTGVGKTDLALACAEHISGEIINADVGQFYTPLSIGTAKPDWQKSAIAHHLFDIINEPKDISVAEYRSLALKTLNDIWHREKMPVIVGGSTFYLSSLFFPPQQAIQIKKNQEYEKEGDLWQQLKDIDPERATQIHPHDVYRISRALDIWYATGTKPSLYIPQYSAPGLFAFFFLTRNRKSLYDRINQRVIAMMEKGWIDEVAALKGTDWEPFLKEKKLIGYDDILNYLDSPQQNVSTLIDTIARKTRNYAKRQITFWNMLEKKLKPMIEKGTKSFLSEIDISENGHQTKKIIDTIKKWKNHA